MDTVRLERVGTGVAVLTLDRPRAMNAIDRAMTAALRHRLAEIEADDGIDVVILTAAGDKAFCVGVDLKERQSFSDAEAQVFRSGELFPMYAALEARTKPAIAVVRGHCLGGGFELALACDMILATDGARFGLPEVKWGLIPAAGGCRKLPRLIGAARAKEMILTAQAIPAAEAERLGIINRVVAPEDIMAAALELAARIRANMQVAVRAAKRCMDLDLDQAATLELADQCYTAKERQQGVANFTGRRS